MIELKQALRFEWAIAPDDVWNSSPFHVEGLHGSIVQTVLGGVADAKASKNASPLGIAVQGQRGAGKTHMLGWIRENVQANGGYFFLVSLLDGNSFWESTVLSILDGLLRESDGKESQLKTLLRRLTSMAGVIGAAQGAIAGDLRLSPDDMSAFIVALRHMDRQVGLECQDTARALVLYASSDLRLQDIGYNYLLSMDEAETGDRAEWGMQRGTKSANLLVKELSRLLALTGPSVIAVDQIDTLIAQSLNTPDGEYFAEDDSHRRLLFDQIAGGLMSLREVTRRTLCVVACLPESWILIRTRAVDTVPDRFREALQLNNIPTAEVGRALIEKRLAFHYREIGFQPQYPTWPVKPSAFVDAPDFTPRGLMKRVGSHIEAGIRRGQIPELDRLVEEPELELVDDDHEPQDGPSVSELQIFDKRLEELKTRADVLPALDATTEDVVMPALLAAGLASLIEETRSSGRVFFQDPPSGGKAVLHARLREDLDEFTEDETHWAFRAIASENAVAALNRIRAACTAVGLHQGMTKRKLYLLRNLEWSRGDRTKEALKAFEDAGGVTLAVESDDLRTFAALKEMLSARDPNLAQWLESRRPASSTRLFNSIFGELSTTNREPVAVPVGPVRSVVRQARNELSSIEFGTATENQETVSAPLESLRKHVAIFAGSGSGKTVLIRRLIEECALQGVSAIVLDPNNDLARLGDAWPEAPEGWSANDSDKAAAYLADTDVVVWTPRRESGRPITFRPLPDFRSVLDDVDEFGAAIDSAVATLAPRAKVDGDVNKAFLGRAVLRETLRHFARQGGAGLRHFISVLADLPSGVSALDRAEKIAADMAQTLTAAMVNDPLFGGEGEAIDPGVLLTPPPGKKARVSVISFVGLPSDDQRQSFVNQLQMALFAWIKKNPAGEKPLGGLFVMDEAQTLAPSGAMTACTQSTLALASQARKYGLGLVFATQAPKALHNRIPGNAATQFFGFLNSPVQIAAAREMAQAKGSEVLDISRLTTGQFYAAGDGIAFQKIQTPLCLSYHPKSPLTTEEVVDRARKSLAGDKPQRFG